MANEDALHRCVTEFMLDTCQYTGSDWASLVGFLCGTADVTIFYSPYETFLSGSSAELYIKPMLSCIGDTDMMAPYNSCLAIPAGHRPPTELPAHFQRRVTVYEIIDSHQPGYVYLKPSYILAKTTRAVVL